MTLSTGLEGIIGVDLFHSYMSHIDLKVSVSIDYRLHIEDRDLVRKRISSWIVKQITDRHEDVLKEAGNKIADSGYIEAYEEDERHGINGHFTLVDKGELAYTQTSSDIYDPALVDESWIPQQEYTRMTKRTVDAFEDVSQLFDLETYEHKIH